MKHPKDCESTSILSCGVPLSSGVVLFCGSDVGVNVYYGKYNGTYKPSKQNMLGEAMRAWFSQVALYLFPGDTLSYLDCYSRSTPNPSGNIKPPDPPVLQFAQVLNAIIPHLVTLPPLTIHKESKKHFSYLHVSSNDFLLPHHQSWEHLTDVSFSFAFAPKRCVWEFNEPLKCGTV